MALEYRICWNAGSNVTFRGHDDWNECDEETDEEVQEAMGTAPGGGTRMPPGLEMALEGSGFDWWVETREVEGDDDDD